VIKLFDAENDAVLGEISDDQLEVLQESLVEESLDEYSWNVDMPALRSLESGGADPALVALLIRALGSRTSMELRCEPE
jgi:hypothetical protein